MARISERVYSACFQQAEYVFNGIKEKKEAVIYLFIYLFPSFIKN